MRKLKKIKESDKEIEKNMTRPRAPRLKEVTDEKWELVNPLYKELMKEYLESIDISDASKKQYTSALKQFGWFAFDKLNNKELYNITRRDGIKFQNFLKNDQKMSANGINFKKAAISAFCRWIETFIVEDDKRFEKFKNFMKDLPPLSNQKVYLKKKVTYDEYRYMMDILEEEGHYLGMAWLAVAFNVGARRGEIVQFKTSIFDEEFDKEKGYVLSNKVRAKGRGIIGKPVEYMINEEAYKYMKLWIEKRGYKDEYVFTVGSKKNHRQVHVAWANYFCEHFLTEILGRRIQPHIFKASCITYLLEVKNVDMHLVSKYIAQHESIETTSIYDLRDFEHERRKIFN